MLVPATHSHFHTFPSSSSSSLFLFPLHFPKTKTLIPTNTTRFHIRSSFKAQAQAQTLSNSAIQRIADKLRTLGFTDQPPTPPPSPAVSTAAGEIFVPLPHHLPRQRVGHTIDTSWSTPDNPVPVPGTGTGLWRQNEVAKEVKEKEKEVNKRREELVPTLAELSLSDSEIMRLTTLGFRMKQKLKVGKAGITEGIVNGIHERWRRSEVVRIVCDDLCKINMKRTHELLERKTGGLVVWRSGSKIILYRGTDYKYPYFLSDNALKDDNIGDDFQHLDGDDENCDERESSTSETNSATSSVQSSNFKTEKPALIVGVGTPNKVRFQLPGEAELAEDANCLLVGLGPRFTDWWGCDPLPVDADLLPAVIPGYRKPFRLLPYGVKPKLTDDEMTTLRRLAKPIPCHFALGRNKKLHGLASAIIKLWERCEIAKIAVKRGVQNTNSEMMAGELKHLTGGTLLARDREFIVLYRGKDFLPPAVSKAIEQRRNIAIHKLKGENSLSVIVTPDLKQGTVECNSEGNDTAFQKDTAIFKQRMLAKAEATIKRTSIKLSMALEKKAKAEKLIAEIESAESLQEQEIDKEGITKEEKYMLRKIGLKMKPFLLLGRRGVFDGTVENMHLHWKYRELVKVICKQESLEDVHQIAQTLEAESGGILVAVERVNKGYAIIVYRGKNYSRPACLRPKTLLSKRESMKRSLEAQRCESLKLHVLKLDKNINELKLQMVEKQEATSKQIAEALRFDLATDEHGACSNSVNLNSPKEISDNNQPAVQEQQGELIDEGGARAVELESWASLIHKETQLDGVSDSVVDDSGARPEEQESGVGLIHKETQFGGVIDSVVDDGGARPGEQDSWAGLIRKETQLDGVSDSVVDDDDGACQGEPESWAGLIHKETQLDGVSDSVVDNGGAHPGEPESLAGLIHKETQLDGVSDSVVDTRHSVPNNKAMESSVTSSRSDPEPSASVINGSSNELPSRSVYLSNKERLLLRKQALRLRKQPLLAVGKSNMVTGLANAIKAHFRKYPLAIVHVKGRAKGTSVQEVVSKLEQATGAVLVSQEPSKVILYRGWGKGEKKPGSAINVNKVGKEEGAKPSVSPELLEAIRVECGLQ
ncbi:CRM-domain containing factor CFM2, chloroplastic [Gastrolobium bilobum]|uniref:CRM-domain containing factor CFM2, chloroplastic n=1 Tax=Gastrolobium bilobum TaxID=150636 RepID=UPI002AB0D393|nr:CRM-domain containing factor CFM2, chloroplastic [Gastrolobium bilobum]